MDKLTKKELSSIELPKVPSVAGWKEIHVKEEGEKLVPLGLFSDYPEIFTDSIYFGEHENSPYPTAEINGSLITCFVRESVAQALKKAQALLPKNLYIVVFDPYRTLKVQDSLYKQYYQKLKLLNSDWNDEELSEETEKYVSIPSTNISRPSPHNTGGSVDLALYELKEGEIFNGLNPEVVQGHGKLLNFGTPYDHGDKEAALDYFEKLKKERTLTSEEEYIVENRRMIYWIMRKVDLEPYQDEWWHYNAKQSQMGARTSGEAVATFGSVELSEENLKHEEKRRTHYFDQIEKFKNGEISINPRSSQFPPAVSITPSK